jgi:hypothetical protein
MQNWQDLYTELCEKITTNLEKIEWVDLWHNQVNFLEEEHPFATPAVFLSFRTLNTQDAGERVQAVTLQVDCYLFYETFSDTYYGSANQQDALIFLGLLNDLHALLHASEGENYSSMRRLAFNPVDTGSAGNLYQCSFECLLTDYAAQKAWEDGSFEKMDITAGAAPESQADNSYNV